MFNLSIVHLFELRLFRQIWPFWALFLITNAPLAADSSSASLVARYEMNPAPNNPQQLVDSGPFHYNGEIKGKVSFVPGHTGQALSFSGDKESFVRIESAPQISRALTNRFTVTAWVRPDSLPTSSDLAGFISTHEAAFHPYSIVLGIDQQSRLVFECDDGGDLSPSDRVGQLKTGEWQHVAVTYDTGGDRVLYLNGVAIDSRHVPFPCNASTEGLWFGWDVDSGFHGALGKVSFYEGALTSDQIKAEMNDNLETTPAKTTDIPAPLYHVQLYLTRFDAPLGLKTDYAPTRQNVKRSLGPNAVDWPATTVEGKPGFHSGCHRINSPPVEGWGSSR